MIYMQFSISRLKLICSRHLFTYFLFSILFVCVLYVMWFFLSFVLLMFVSELKKLCEWKVKNYSVHAKFKCIVVFLFIVVNRTDLKCRKLWQFVPHFICRQIEEKIVATKKNKPKIFDKRKTLFRICRSINCLSSSSNNFPIKLNSLFEFNDIKCAEKLVKCQFCMCMWCVKKSTNVFSIYKKKHSYTFSDKCSKLTLR